MLYGFLTGIFLLPATVSAQTSHEEVDLGLSVIWASTNVGATATTDIGTYYQFANRDIAEANGGFELTSKINGAKIFFPVTGYMYVSAGHDLAPASTSYATVQAKPPRSASDPPTGS